MTRSLALLQAALFLASSTTWAEIGTAVSANATVDTRDLPEIAVEQSSGANIADGAVPGQVFASRLGASVSRTFVLRNLGLANLTNSSATIDGPDAASFAVTASPAASVSGPSGSTSFTVRFAPASGGNKTAALHLANNDADENPFDIDLNGKVLTYTEDADGDGLSDASEFQMAALGFDWQIAQSELVNTYFASANAAGLYTAAQVQALNVGTPLLTLDPRSGRFRLTVAVRKSPSPNQPFSALPMNAPQTTTVINAQGELEFEFSAPDDAAFFRLEAR